MGFLYLDDSTINGNLGIKDQRLAIEWINSFIHNFGGDSSSITLFGQSAGAISIGAHLISPQSKGLFSSVIIQSNPWKIPFSTVKQASVLGSEFLKVRICYLLLHLFLYLAPSYYLFSNCTIFVFIYTSCVALLSIIGNIACLAESCSQLKFVTAARY